MFRDRKNCGVKTMNGTSGWVQMAMVIAVSVCIFKVIKRKIKEKREKEEQEQVINRAKAIKAQQYINWVAKDEVGGRENDVVALMEYMEPKMGGKFKLATLGPYSYAYCFPYYPVGRIKDEDPIWASNRQMVYDFKLGNYQTAAVLLVDFLRGRYSRNELECFTLCVIPASTMEKNERRYRRFCEYVSAKTGIQNGMDAISILYDRQNSREGKSENTVQNLAFSDEVIGVDVLLFDDIMTRGTSFTQCAGRLMEKGANSVTGFFLGKTIC